MGCPPFSFPVAPVRRPSKKLTTVGRTVRLCGWVVYSLLGFPRSHCWPFPFPPRLPGSDNHSLLLPCGSPTPLSIVLLLNSPQFTHGAICFLLGVSLINLPMFSLLSIPLCSLVGLFVQLQPQHTATEPLLTLDLSTST